MSTNIKNKVIVITGASSGLGQATAMHLASLGAKVVLGARRKEVLDQIVAKIIDNGGDAVSFGVDVTKKEEVQGLVDFAVATYGQIDVMLNNAGIMPVSPFDQYKIAEWDNMIDINIKGVLYGIAAALPYFSDQNSGHFINVSSVAGHKTGPGMGIYSATKSAVRMLTEGLRIEVKPYNIRTTIISPGAVATNLRNSISDEELRASINENYKNVDIPADSFVKTVEFAISQPEYMDINEILFRPVNQEF